MTRTVYVTYGIAEIVLITAMIFHITQRVSITCTQLCREQEEEERCAAGLSPVERPPGGKLPYRYRTARCEMPPYAP